MVYILLEEDAQDVREHLKASSNPGNVIRVIF